MHSDTSAPLAGSKGKLVPLVSQFYPEFILVTDLGSCLRTEPNLQAHQGVCSFGLVLEEQTYAKLTLQVNSWERKIQ